MSLLGGKETKFGKCPVCGNVNVLTFVIGQKEGHLWCNWICETCLNDFHEKDWGKQKDENVQ